MESAQIGLAGDLMRRSDGDTTGTTAEWPDGPRDARVRGPPCADGGPSPAPVVRPLDRQKLPGYWWLSGSFLQRSPPEGAPVHHAGTPSPGNTATTPPRGARSSPPPRASPQP
ncbi:hypothetical protein GCM10020295_53190 [Streptomyces cinereospinus]